MNENQITSIIAFVVLAVVIGVISKISSKSDCKKYDERQLLARGNAYKYGFFTFLFEIWFGIILFDSDSIDLLPVTPSFLLVAGFILAIMVFTNYAIVKDAFSTDANFKKMIIMYLVIAILNIGISVTRIFDGTLFTDGKLNGTCINLLLGFLFLEVSVLQLIRNRIAKVEEE